MLLDGWLSSAQPTLKTILALLELHGVCIMTPKQFEKRFLFVLCSTKTKSYPVIRLLAHQLKYSDD